MITRQAANCCFQKLIWTNIFKIKICNYRTVFQWKIKIHTMTIYFQAFPYLQIKSIIKIWISSWDILVRIYKISRVIIRFFRTKILQGPHCLILLILKRLCSMELTRYKLRIFKLKNNWFQKIKNYKKKNHLLLKQCRRKSMLILNKWISLAVTSKMFKINQ